MIKQLISIITMLLITTVSKAQEVSKDSIDYSKYPYYAIGYYMDINGNEVNGYLDQEYNPISSAVVNTTKEEEKNSSYYVRYDGKKKHLNIYLVSGKHVHYVTKGNEFKKKKARKIEKVVLNYGQQVYFKIDQYYKGSLKTKKLITKKPFLISKIDKLKEVDLYNSSDTYFYKKGDHFYKLSAKYRAELITHLRDLFGEKYRLFIVHKEKEEDFLDFTEEIDILNTFKKYELYQKFKNGRPIFYDLYWNELDGEEEAVYFQKYTKFLKGLYEVETRLMNGTLMAVDRFSSLFPHINQGESLKFHLNGNVRRRVFYEDNEPSGSVYQYFPTGQLHWRLTITKKDRYLYDQIFNKKGDSLLVDQTGEEVFVDEIRNYKIERKYKKGKLFYSKVYYNDSLSYHQMPTKDEFKYGAQPFFRKSISINKTPFPEKFLKENKKGTDYVTILCNGSMDISSIKNTGRQIYADSYQPSQFKRNYYLKDSDKLIELLLPIHIKRKTYSSPSYSYDYNWMWYDHNLPMMNNNVIDHQMMQQTIKNLQAPNGF